MSLMIVGDTKTGKSAIINRLFNDVFDKKYVS